MKKILLILLMLFMAVGVFADITISTDAQTDFVSAEAMAKVAISEEIFPGLTANASGKVALTDANCFGWTAGLVYTNTSFGLDVAIIGDPVTLIEDLKIGGALTVIDGIAFNADVKLHPLGELFAGAEGSAVLTMIPGLSVTTGYVLGSGYSVNAPYSTLDGSIFIKGVFTF